MNTYEYIEDYVITARHLGTGPYGITQKAFAIDNP